MREKYFILTEKEYQEDLAKARNNGQREGFNKAEALIQAILAGKRDLKITVGFSKDTNAPQTESIMSEGHKENTWRKLIDILDLKRKGSKK